MEKMEEIFQDDEAMKGDGKVGGGVKTQLDSHNIYFTLIGLISCKERLILNN